LSVAGQAAAVGAASVNVIDNNQLGWDEGDDLADHTVDADYLDRAIDVEDYAEPAEREPGVVAAATQLGIGDYDRSKERLAKSLAIGIRSLDALVKAARLRAVGSDGVEPENTLQFGEVEPWEHPVEGQQLFDEIVSTINRYVVLQPGQAAAVALWVMMSWLFERFKILPQLLVSSPVKRCGKTTLLELITYIVNRPLAASNVTGPAVFRSIEMYRPTFVIDEADTYLAQGANPELTGVLNSGHNRALAYVIRIEEVDGERVPVRYSTFCPKVMAMIEVPSDTQLDRSIVVVMQRKPAAQSVQSLGLNAEQSFHDLKRKLTRWRDDTPETFEHDISACPPLPNDRARQNWSALLSVARLVGSAADEQGLQAVRLLHDTSHLEVDRGADLLADIRSVFRTKKSERMTSKELLKALNEMPDRPWANHNHGREMNGHGLAKALRPFGLGPIAYKDGAKPVKGYLLANLRPVFERYLQADDGQ
jgi:putative DNA primase/helicase